MNGFMNNFMGPRFSRRKVFIAVCLCGLLFDLIQKFLS